MPTRQGGKTGTRPRREASAPQGTGAADLPELSISREKVCHIVFKVREFDEKDLPTISDDGSNPADWGDVSVLEDRPDDPLRQGLAAFISALDFDEQVDLVRLTWMGRGDGTIAALGELRD